MVLDAFNFKWQPRCCGSGSAVILEGWIRSLKVMDVLFWKAGGFSFSWNVLHGSLGINKYIAVFDQCGSTTWPAVKFINFAHVLQSIYVFDISLLLMTFKIPAAFYPPPPRPPPHPTGKQLINVMNHLPFQLSSHIPTCQCRNRGAVIKILRQLSLCEILWNIVLLSFRFHTLYLYFSMFSMFYSERNSRKIYKIKWFLWTFGLVFSFHDQREWKKDERADLLPAPAEQAVRPSQPAAPHIPA